MTAAALAAAPPASVAVQLREKDLDARELVELGRQLRAICDRDGTRLLVNDRLDVANAVRADGVHLPADSFSVADARELIGQNRLVGVSTHDNGEVIAASQAGADFVVYGPIFDPLSKAAYTVARGAEGMIEAGRVVSIALYALGGITASRIRELQTAMAAARAHQPIRIATIGAIYGAPDPAAAMRELISAIAS